jgi:hypothetical protein
MQHQLTISAPVEALCGALAVAARLWRLRAHAPPAMARSMVQVLACADAHDAVLCVHDDKVPQAQQHKRLQVTQERRAERRQAVAQHMTNSANVSTLLSSTRHQTGGSETCHSANDQVRQAQQHEQLQTVQERQAVLHSER